MAESENEKVIKDLIEAYNRQNPSDMVAFLADDVQAIWMDLRRENKEEIENSFTWFFSVFPDARADIDLILTKGSNVAVEFTFNGTHKGELFGIQPTSRKVEGTMVWLFDFEGGKVKSWREYFNPEPLLQSLRD